jgi:chemotaxis protein MotA
MDLTVLIGIIGAIASISIGDILEGGNPVHVVHITSLIIVIPTSMFAAAAASEFSAIKAAFVELKMVFKQLPIDFDSRIDELVEYSILVKKNGVLALEKYLEEIDDEFLKEAMNMVVDGSKEEQIEESLDAIIEETEHYYHSASHYWILAAETSPTIGLIGAVLGLILALQRLDNPAEMAAGIAGAFTATVTGIAASYVFFGPWGNKMRAKARTIIKEKEIILYAAKAIVRGDAPGELKLKLSKMTTVMPLRS